MNCLFSHTCQSNNFVWLCDALLCSQFLNNVMIGPFVFIFRWLFHGVNMLSCLCDCVRKWPRVCITKNEIENQRNFPCICHPNIHTIHYTETWIVKKVTHQNIQQKLRTHIYTRMRWISSFESHDNNNNNIRVGNSWAKNQRFPT